MVEYVSCWLMRSRIWSSVFYGVAGGSWLVREEESD